MVLTHLLSMFCPGLMDSVGFIFANIINRTNLCMIFIALRVFNGCTGNELHISACYIKARYMKVNVK